MALNATPKLAQTPTAPPTPVATASPTPTNLSSASSSSGGSTVQPVNPAVVTVPAAAAVTTGVVTSVGLDRQAKAVRNLLKEKGKEKDFDFLRQDQYFMVEDHEYAQQIALGKALLEEGGYSLEDSDTNLEKLAKEFELWTDVSRNTPDKAKVQRILQAYTEWLNKNQPATQPTNTPTENVSVTTVVVIVIVIVGAVLVLLGMLFKWF